MRKLHSVLVLVLAACDPAATGLHRGEPIATLRGQLSLADGLTVSGDVRLALVWYPPPDADGGTSLPRDIAYQELSYSGQFPQAFTFGLYEPPPESAIMHPEGDPSGAMAQGYLVAYEDLDHDGRLTIGSLGATADRVLGSTAGAGNAELLPNMYWVLWLRHGSETEVTGTPGLGGVPGYNLAHFRGFQDPLTQPVELIPLDTTIPLQLTGARHLQLIVCPEAYGAKVEEACGIPLWDAPSMQGAITLREDGSLSVGVSVQGAVTTLSVNGVAIPWDPHATAHALYEPVPSVLRVGVNDLVVEADGYDPYRFQVTVPSLVNVTSPTPGSTLQQGSALTATWAPAVGATEYEAVLSVGAQPYDWKVVSSTHAALTVPHATGPCELQILAYDKAPSFSRVSVVGTSVRTVTCTIAP